MKFSSFLLVTALLFLATLCPAFAADPLEIKVFDGETYRFGEAYKDVTVDLPDGNWTSIVLKNAYDAGIGTEQDPWDRIASTHVFAPDGNIVELSRDITDYGFTTVHARNITKFASILKGRVTFRVYLTTWTSGIWKVRSIITFYSEGQAVEQAKYVIPVAGERGYGNSEDPGGPYTIRFNGIYFPPGMNRVQLWSYATGHTQAEEFGPRRTLTYGIDGVNVGANAPWRTNCDHCDNHGTTYNRSGWCPGSAVNLINFTVTDRSLLTPGDHNLTISFNGLKASWEVSLAALGFEDTPTPTPTETPLPQPTGTPTETPTPEPTPTPITARFTTVAVAGFMMADVTVEHGGRALLWAFAGLPQLNADQMTVYLEGTATTVTLTPLGNGVFQLEIPLDAGVVPGPTMVLVELMPSNGGVAGRLWPYMQVLP